MGLFNENVFSAIAKSLSFGKMRRELKKIEKMVDDDPSLKAELDAAAKANQDLEKSLKSFCQRNPNHPMCNTSELKKNSTITVKY